MSIESNNTLEGKTILVIEDDEFISRVYTKWLEKNGARALKANNGETGLKVLEKEQADLVLLDVGMPGIDGIEVLRQIRKYSNTSEVKVIILSNTTFEVGSKEYKEIIDNGADAILRKYEVSLDDLAGVIIKCFSDKSSTG